MSQKMDLYIKRKARQRVTIMKKYCNGLSKKIVNHYDVIDTTLHTLKPNSLLKMKRYIESAVIGNSKSNF